MRSPFRLLRAAVRITAASPRTAWLIVRMLGWKVALAALKRTVPLARLVRLVEPSLAPTRDERERARVEFAIRRLGRVLARGDCLERSLVAYRYLARAGAPPRLSIGFDRDDGRVEGHAWVTVDGRPVAESEESLRRYVEVASFAPGASAGSP